MNIELEWNKYPGWFSTLTQDQQESLIARFHISRMSKESMELARKKANKADNNWKHQRSKQGVSFQRKK